MENAYPLVKFRLAAPGDLPQIAEVFLAAFPQSVLHYASRGSEQVWDGDQVLWTGGRRLMADLFGLCLASEPAAFHVAEDASRQRIAGYIFAPAHASRLIRTALAPGRWCALNWRLATGQYQLPLRALWLAGRNALAALTASGRERREGLECDARIFSVAVSPAYQGQGLGTALTRAGLAYLRVCGERRVRLEVRPENPAAIQVYAKLGFTVRGETRDSQGRWLIMLLDLTS